MEGIKLDKDKITTFKGKKNKKVLFLEIARKPDEIRLDFEKNFICINDRYYIFDFFDFKGNLQTGLEMIIFSIILHFGLGGNSEVSGLFIITGLVFLLGLSFIVMGLVIKN